MTSNTILSFSHYLLTLPTIISTIFVALIFRRHRENPGSYYLLWWSRQSILLDGTPKCRQRPIGDTFIAAGAILPGIGGKDSRIGMTEILYTGEFVGVFVIWAGGKYSQKPMSEVDVTARLARRSTVETSAK